VFKTTINGNSFPLTSTRITRENATLEQDAKKGMTDLKWLQESIKTLKKRKTEKATNLEILKKKIHTSTVPPNKPRPPNPDFPMPNDDASPLASDDPDHYYSSYRHLDNTGFKG
jgi:hypothetical protein